MIPVLFVYGLAFFVLGMGTLLQPKKGSMFTLANSLWLIATFGILHGINEWIDMFLLIQKPVEITALKVLRTVILPVSFLFLLQFGIKLLIQHKQKYHQWLKAVPVFLFALWTAIVLFSDRKFLAGDIWARYLLGIPGIFLTSYAFTLQIGEFKNTNLPIFTTYTKLLAGAFFFYGFFAGLVVPEAPFFPANLLNASLFLDIVGVPVQVFRTLCAIVAACSMTRLLSLFEWETRNKLLIEITERKHAENDLKHFYEFTKTAFNGINEAIAVIDVNGFRITGVNSAFLAEYGYRNESEVIGRTCYEVTHRRHDACTPPDDICPLIDTVRTGKYAAADHVHYNKQGKKIYAEVSTSPIQDDSGNIIQVIHMARDITERKELEEELKENNRVFLDFMDNCNDLIQSITADGRFLFVNKAWRETLGYTDEDIRNLSVFDIIHPEMKPHCMEIFKKITAGERIDKVETVFVTKDGRSIAVEGNINTRFENGIPTATRGIFRDVTKRKALEEELQRLATTDKLTEICNRSRLEEILKAEMERVDRYKSPLCLLMFDIDHFKDINDTYGHQVGDAVLKEMAALVKEQVRVTDYWGRWGGEEFIMIAPETTGEKAAEAAEKIRRLVGAYRFETVGTVTLSCGIAEYGDDDTIYTLLGRADDALYRAKNKGRNRVEV